MANLPSGWAASKLSAVSYINMGQSPKGEHTNTDGFGTPLVGGASEFSTINPIAKKYTTQPTKLSQVGDILMCIRATIGKINVADKEYCLGRGVAGFRALLCDHKWLVYYLMSQASHIDAAGTGSTFRQVDKKTLENWPAPVPPVEEQQRIANMLDALLARSNKAKNALDTIPSLLEQYRQSILLAAFQGDLTKDWQCNTFKKWNIRTLGSIIDNIQSGKSFKCVERPPKATEKGIVKVSAVSWGRFNEDESKTVTDISRLNVTAKIHEGDLLFSRANTIELVGACVITSKFNKDLYLSDKILRLDVPEEYKIYLKWFLRSPSGRKQIEEMATGAQHSMRNISQSSLKKITMPMPSESEMIVIGQTLEKMEKFLDQVSSKVKDSSLELKTLNQSILAKAFRGELVPQDPNDEPASNLLERIKITFKQLENDLKTKKKIAREKTSSKRIKMIIPIIDALKQSEKPLSAQQLLSAAGYPNNADTDQLEQFFLDIRKAIDDMQVEIWREDDQDYFRLAG